MNQYFKKFWKIS